MSQPGVSFVLPVHNGERWLDEVLASILAQGTERPFEIIAVDDGSTDRSPGILAKWARDGRFRVRRAVTRGAGAALNTGLREARHPTVCLIDQDVVLEPGWLDALLPVLAAPHVAAVQGCYVTDPQAPCLARVMGMDLEQRYDSIRGAETNHVCTGNSAYRAEALHEVGLFDESLGYGCDNDMSYRLAAAGYALRFSRTARSTHRWRETLGSYLVQQYGFGYGRLDLVAKHLRGFRGDSVSPLTMMAHAPLMLGAIGSGLVSLVLAAGDLPWRPVGWFSIALVGVLALERFVAGVRATVRHRDPSGLCFVPIHLLRDAAWALAIVIWSARRLARREPSPSHSMPRNRTGHRPQAMGHRGRRRQAKP